jgi:cbb3-type cytochrome oxidase maturation protein
VSVIFVVLPVALLLGAAAVGGFVWATKRGQFDDLTTPALRALHDDSERVRKEPKAREGDEPGSAGSA